MGRLETGDSGIHGGLEQTKGADVRSTGDRGSERVEGVELQREFVEKISNPKIKRKYRNVKKKSKL